MTLGLLAVHLQMQHMKATGGRRHRVTTTPSRDPRTYKTSFPTFGGPRNCPAKGCRVQAAIRTVIQVNYFHRHVQDTVIIMEEGNLPHTRCPRCNILVPW